MPYYREDDFQMVVGSNSGTIWKTMYLESPDGVTNIAVEKMRLHNKSIFNIGVRQEPHGLSTRLSKIIYRLAAWFLGCLEASSVAYPTLFLLVESVGDPIFIFLASSTVGHCLHMFCDKVLIQFLSPWSV